MSTVSQGHRWKSHRKFLTPAFHYNILQSFLPVFLKNTKVLTKQLWHLADETAFDLFPIMALAALDNVTGKPLSSCKTFIAGRRDAQKNAIAIAQVFLFFWHTYITHACIPKGM